MSTEDVVRCIKYICPEESQKKEIWEYRELQLYYVLCKRNLLKHFFYLRAGAGIFGGKRVLILETDLLKNTLHCIFCRT
ncbi:hypothetical protein GWI33_015277 [Rhynchophorus ferrugineus]|uniref:Uncharacterized protein n=1 Tax=Rhynchophorus ferrugineus TaxID=354439 RepID=A0A834I111_RHYFE|nr:hypothetical protein GWI33_015277 [Rhynchophorus ferrugineus]